MISGFQNHLHALYGLPGGWSDNSDVLDRGAWAKRKRKTEEEKLEEQIAAQLLQARQRKLEIPAKVDPIKLGAILKSKLYDVRQGEVTGDDRIKRIRYLLLALTLDD